MKKQHTNETLRIQGFKDPRGQGKKRIDQVLKGQKKQPPISDAYGYCSVEEKSLSPEPSTPRILEPLSKFPTKHIGEPYVI
jgi:hypothetical protein